MIVVGIDQSLVCTGLVALELRGDTWNVREATCIRTKPDTKASHLYKADQDGLRLDEVSAGLEAFLVRTPGPRLVAMEAPAGAQSATAAKALALAYATVRTTLRMMGIAPLVVQAHHAKKAATGSASATKEDVERAMRQAYTWPDAKRSKPEAEAIADALAVATAALNEPTARAFVDAHRGRAA